LKSFLEKEGIPYSFVDVDLLQGEDRDRALREVDAVSTERAFPLTLINGRLIKGFNPEQILAALHADDEE